MAPLPKQTYTPQLVEGVAAGKASNYKSPQKKLVRFFARSRDQWKEKCLAAKAMGKGLKHRMRFLERSKDHWKRRVKALEGERTRMKVHAQAMQEEIATLKKRGPQNQAVAQTAQPRCIMLCRITRMLLGTCCCLCPSSYPPLPASEGPAVF
jgi:hypothetical protein